MYGNKTPLDRKYGLASKRTSSSRRIKTSPIEKKINPELTFDESNASVSDNCDTYDIMKEKERRTHHYILSSMSVSQTPPHYLDIKEIQPKVAPQKNIKDYPKIKRVSVKGEYPSRGIQAINHSLTEPFDKPYRNITT